MFYFLGTIRATQWNLFRNWTLRERSAVSARLRAIEAELQRIGAITVFYEKRTAIVQTPQGAQQEIETVSEKRSGMSVSPGSSMEKLVWAYIAQGGNPCDISLFLTPDDVQFASGDPMESPTTNPNTYFSDSGAAEAPSDQPYYGVVAPQSSDSYGPGGRFMGGLPTFLRNPTNLIGRYIDLSDANSSIAIRTDAMRRWTEASIKEMDRLEHEIRKLADLREQLQQERDDILTQAVGGSVDDIPLPDPNRYARTMHLATIVAEMDAVFYETNVEGAPNFDSIRIGTKDQPEGISNFDTLFADPTGYDPFTSL